MLCFVFSRIKPHLGQFSLYILSGCGALVIDLGSYLLMLEFGVWYAAASFISGTLGFCMAFALHKYVVFQKRDDFLQHVGRYFFVDIINNVITTGILYVLVSLLSVDPHIGKVIAMAPVILWNFFVYKFFVYV